MTALTIVSILGETREVSYVYPDGSYTCPFCGGAVVNGRDDDVCRNPACDAGAFATVERAEANRAKRERRAAEAAERERRAEAQRAAFQSFAESRRENVAEWHRLADEDGYCLTCLVRTDGRKRIRHRTDAHGVAA